MIRTFLAIALVLLFVGAASAQQADIAELQTNTTQSNLGIKAAPSPWSLLDASRITWSHSYSVSYFSGGGSSGSLGMLNSSMLYELSSSLHLTLNLGVLHNTGAIWGDGDNSASFLPGFRLDYQPSDKFFMSISFQQYNGYVSPYSYGDYRYSRYPYFWR
ncbi:MAG: hypothetical protein GY867_05415 [bacterium]|nr:hypothetical protein [bacterium]